MTEIRANLKQCSLTVLLISQSFLNRFGCFWARFKRGGLENLYPYPYPCLPACLTRAGSITRDNLYSRDSQGRFVSRNSTYDTKTSGSPAINNTLVTADSSRAASRLLSNYDLVIPSYPSTPASKSPTFPNIPLPPNPFATTHTTNPGEPDDDSEPDQEYKPKTENDSEDDSEEDLAQNQSKTTKTDDMTTEHVTPFHRDKEDENPDDFLRSYYMLQILLRH